MSQSYGLTLAETQGNQNHPVIKAEHFKPGTIKVGEASVPVGGLLAREIATGHYKKLGTVTTKTGEALTITPVDNNGKYAVGFETDNKPILPGSVVISCHVAGALASITDNMDGVLKESTNQAQGTIDYNTGLGDIRTFAVMASATDLTFSGTYKHFNNAGALDINDICVNALRIKDATSEAKPESLMDEGLIDPARVTPIIDSTDPLQVRLLKKNRIRIEHDIETLS
mgnify:CR=1 FL=1